MNSKSAVDSTKLKKKIPYYQKVDIQSAIDSIDMAANEDGKPCTRGAEILTYENNGRMITPQRMVNALKQSLKSKNLDKHEKESIKLNSVVVAELEHNGTMRKVRLCNKKFKRRKMDNFYKHLDLMLLEVQATIMHGLLTR